eukprot:PLAT5876.1.p1 GENE.PLAT5876.1~~PLAT5876.1.p1  ORF type:complete len:246 (+),score=120.34 PLAT5876.1:44-739(+)
MEASKWADDDADDVRAASSKLEERAGGSKLADDGDSDDDDYGGKRAGGKRGDDDDDASASASGGAADVDAAEEAAGLDTVAVPRDPVALAKRAGFKIKSMNMRDADRGGAPLWESDDWDGLLERELTAHVPKSILSCRAVSREIVFSSEEALNTLNLKQEVFFCGKLLEEWEFKFTFVMPHSENSWQSTIYAADPDKMLPAEVLSGNIVIRTSFYDEDTFIAGSVVRVFYV